MSHSGAALKKYEVAIRAASPACIAEFLSSQGWRKGRDWRGKGFDWVTPANENVLVPTDPTLQHYAATIQGVFEMLVTDDVTFEDVLALASNGPSDIVRRRIDEPATQSGSCSLEDARAGFAAMRELLGASSRRYALKSGGERKLAATYVDQCRAGQTEFGSYVLKVYTPIVVAGSPRDRRTFGRNATMAAMNNVNFLAAEHYSPEDPLPAEMDWHVAESVVRMRSIAALWGGQSRLSVKYMANVSATEDHAIPESDAVSIPMTSALFDRAQSVYETLKRGEMFERMALIGHITDLHKDVPGSRTQERRITIRARVEGRDRNVTMCLMPTDYSRAVSWHDNDVLVRVDANVDKRWKVWTAPEYYGIVALRPQQEESQTSMFP